MKELTRSAERLLVLRRSSGRQRISFRRGARQRARLLSGFVERLVGRIRNGIDSGIGLHDRRPVDGKMSHLPEAQHLFPEARRARRVRSSPESALASRGYRSPWAVEIAIVRRETFKVRRRGAAYVLGVTRN